MTDPCTKTEVIDYIKERVDRIDSKTDLLLADRNRMKGFIIGVVSVVTIVFNLIVFVVKK